MVVFSLGKNFLFESALGHCECQHFWQTLEDIILINRKFKIHKVSKFLVFVWFYFLWWTKEFNKGQVKINFKNMISIQILKIHSKRKFLFFFNCSKLLNWFDSIFRQRILLAIRIVRLNSGHCICNKILFSSCCCPHA